MFEKLKQRLLERIERDAVMSEMTYKPDKDSDETITEKVYMKRSKIPFIGDWARIYPPVTEDGKWNFVNLVFGGKRNLIKLIIIGGVVAAALTGFYELFQHIEYLEGLPVPGVLLG